MAIQPKVSIQEFEAFIALSENADRLFELIDGEIAEKVPSNPYASFITHIISFFIEKFIRENGIRGYITGEAGGFVIGGNRQAPDAAYISKEREPDQPTQKLGIDDTLDGGDLLPGFTLPLKDIFTE